MRETLKRRPEEDEVSGLRSAARSEQTRSLDICELQIGASFVSSVLPF
jgi:hypothetical protein